MRSRVRSFLVGVVGAARSFGAAIGAAVADYMATEPARFWGNVATGAILVYHLVNPIGDKDTVITDAITTLAPRVAAEIVRPRVSPVNPQEGAG